MRGGCRLRGHHTRASAVPARATHASADGAPVRTSVSDPRGGGKRVRRTHPSARHEQAPFVRVSDARVDHLPVP